VDLLVNAAGLGPPIGPFADTDPEQWWRTVEVNLKGPAVWCRAVLPDMTRRRRGRIVNVASGAGTVAIPYLSAYVTSKAALIRLSEVLAAEVASAGVKVFAIEPGTVRTAMAEEALTSEAGRRWMGWFRDIFDAGRDVTPEHAAELVLWLARGRGDALSGRFIARGDDLEDLRRRADAIVAADELALRVRRPGRAR
jgi:NAD(P)-dependent dehydrogenase (short-subunit alcohol dehydrogenase family)